MKTPPFRRGRKRRNTWTITFCPRLNPCRMARLPASRLRLSQRSIRMWRLKMIRGPIFRLVVRHQDDGSMIWRVWNF
uniref:Uncharacterized protein n=1 Tax=Klebsiella pneumoniae TaxID=573 RepID=A0A8B0SX23_KLEPN|nr:hypothetical protein [Klebsiella pneumoniae]